jgi:predicted benzoate:H+ symporter BenE
MISQPIEKDGVVRYYVGVLVAMMTMIAGLLAACLIGLWRTIPCSEADMKYKVIGCGILGTIGYLAGMVNLYRLRHRAGRPSLSYSSKQ